MTTQTAVRARRVRFFQILFVFLLLAILLDTAFVWQDEVVAPGISLRYVEVPSADGVTLSGILFRPSGAQGPLPGVVVVHGITAYKESLNRISVEMARRGFVVLAIDLRDHGMSNGQCAFGAPGAEPEDVANAVDYLRGVEGVDRTRTAVVGHSFGGMAALTAVSMNKTQVNATVVWAAPTNLTSLRRDNFETVLFVVDKRVVPPDILEPEQLRIRSPVTYLAGARPDSVMFMHGDADPLIPVNQSLEGVNATRGADYKIYTGVDHGMDRIDIVEDTIAFIELRTKGQTSVQMDPVYPAFVRDGVVLMTLLALLAVPVGWLGYERWCTRNPLPVKHYNYPGNTTPLQGVAFMVADVVIFVAAVWVAAQLFTPGGKGLLFQGVLPASGLFTVLLAGGVFLALGANVLASVERRVRGRDEIRYEAAESLARSALTVTSALLVLPLTVALQWVLFQGANYPRGAGFFLALFVFTMLAVGFEALVRLRIQRRLRTLFHSVARDGGVAHSAVSILAGTAIYFVMFGWIVAVLLRGYISDVAGTTAALTLAVGLLSSIFYDRTRNILGGSIYTGVFMTWVFNASFHF